MIEVENHTGCPVFLEEGHLLGTLEPIEIMPKPPNLCFLSHPNKSADVDRMNKLLKGLDIEETLEEANREKLYMLIEEFQDIFALDPSELGCTKLVQHVIDTGDHPPIRQDTTLNLFVLWNKT